MVPTMFGIAFEELFLNQAGALVHVYTDGSVLLSHGGTEMGQGLHTKMIQVASRVLQIPPDLVHISETGTDKVPNTSSTAASLSSDLNGMAVLTRAKLFGIVSYRTVLIILMPDGTNGYGRHISIACPCRLLVSTAFQALVTTVKQIWVLCSTTSLLALLALK